MKVGIIGAGPAGLTAAYAMARRGHAVDVFEGASDVGGMARSFSLWGQRVDLGPHRFFSKDPRVNELWHELAAGDYQVLDRLTRIYHAGRLFRYPLQPWDALQKLGLGHATGCLADYAWQRLKNICGSQRPPATFEDWIVAAFGRTLFETFFKDYSEKLWGMASHELDADFAAQRIKQFSLGSAVLRAIGLERHEHPTLAEKFCHPSDGSGMIYERMARQIRHWGGEIHLNTPVRGLGADAGTLVLGDGDCRRFDHIISTMPLTTLVEGLPDAPHDVRAAAAELTYRHTILVYLLVDQASLFPDQWLYLQSPEVKVGRLTNFNNWGIARDERPGQSILAMEYWCDSADAIWSGPDADISAMARRELAQTGLIGAARVTATHIIRVPRCYPVYRVGYKARLEPVIAYLRGLPQVDAIGRYGSFKYNNQDHSILMGLLVAENLCDGTHHDLWQINTDYQVYQEQGPAAVRASPRPDH